MDVNNSRLLHLLDVFSQFGKTPLNGVTRLALSSEDKLARDYLIKLSKEAGFSIKIDAIGNIFIRRSGKDNRLAPILIGSHGDSQPLGGRYDGIYGVLAGLEVLLSLNDHNIETERPIDLVMWTNEEGARFSPAMLGASVFIGNLSLIAALSEKDKDGISVEEALNNINYLGTDDFSSYHPYAVLELHIEQGPVLENNQTEIGVVTGALGQSWYQIKLMGLSSHAGTTPMNMRQDASVGMANAIVKFNKLGLREVVNQGRVTVGQIKLTPNSPNVIPGEAYFTLEVRHPNEQSLINIEREIYAILNDIARENNLVFDIKKVVSLSPVKFNSELIKTIQESCALLGYSWEYIVSGAGHDACQLNHKFPTSMIFIPCVDGLSHNEAENITDDWCQKGAKVLLDSTVTLANQI